MKLKMGKGKFPVFSPKKLVHLSISQWHNDLTMKLRMGRGRFPVFQLVSHWTCSMCFYVSSGLQKQLNPVAFIYVMRERKMKKKACFSLSQLVLHYYSSMCALDVSYPLESKFSIVGYSKTWHSPPVHSFKGCITLLLFTWTCYSVS